MDLAMQVLPRFFHGTAGMVNLLSLAGLGANHDIQRALNV
jgi:hypothetical protein